MDTYKILRFNRRNENPEVIKRGLTLEEAQTHCGHEWTHKKDRAGNVIWFDGYTKEENLKKVI